MDNLHTDHVEDNESNEDVVSRYGDFCVTHNKKIGRNFLHHNGDLIARCIGGNWGEIHGDIPSWLTKLYKTSGNRLENIDNAIEEMETERMKVFRLMKAIHETDAMS